MEVSVLSHYPLYRFLNTTLLLVWAATTRNKDYIKMQGLKRVISVPDHRKEFVAGNLQDYCTSSTLRLA